MKERFEILADLINYHNYTKVVEVGCNRGLNAAEFIARCPKLEKVYLIDLPTNEVFSIGEFKDKKIEHKIQYLPIGSKEASKQLENNLDLIFIDANHSYEAVKEDISNWLPKIRKGGILSGHDYGTIHGCEDVKKAVDELFPKANIEEDVLENGEVKIWWVYV